MRISHAERLKAEYLTEYRALCERYGLMVAYTYNEEVDYNAFCVAELNPTIFEQILIEMNVEKTRSFREESNA